jgi:hypothetical protein
MKSALVLFPTAVILTLYFKEELMFEDIANPLKGKGKEKDVGKRRAYVRIITSLGPGSLNLELYCEKVCFEMLNYGYKPSHHRSGAKNMLQFSYAR